MLLAWMVTGSVGIFIASFYKPDWPSKSLLGQKVWFQVSKRPEHRHCRNTATFTFLSVFWAYRQSGKTQVQADNSESGGVGVGGMSATPS